MRLASRLRRGALLSGRRPWVLPPSGCGSAILLLSGALFKHGHGRKLLAFQELKEGAAARGDVGDAVGNAELVHGGNRVAAAGDREGALVGRLGDIYVAFVPDEEIGLLGAKKIDFSKFPVDFAYTVDCCELGEVVYETFNAGSATIRIKGVTAHPMSSKGVLVNPTLIATDFVQMMDRGSTPECTEGTEGFVWVNSIVSNPSQATVSIKIRDHNREKYEAKKALIASAVEYLKVRNPRARIELEVKDMYGNIADALTDDNRCAVDHLYRALEIAGVKANTIAMRGGTDGSFISTQGVITPNYFTGGHNFHSNCEFLPLGAAVKSTEVTLTLIDLIAGTKH